ncbi:MAG: hypothetical protein CEN88_438, partial [Candidatus Berkelbacteria bacterium Licking1014_2]
MKNILTYLLVLVMGSNLFIPSLVLAAEETAESESDFCQEIYYLEENQTECSDYDDASEAGTEPIDEETRQMIDSVPEPAKEESIPPSLDELNQPLENLEVLDSIFYDGRPRLVFNSVDLAILKSYVAAEQLEQVVSSVGVADRETVDTIIQYAFDPGQIEAVLQSPAEKANFIQNLEAAEKVSGLPA